MKIWKQDFNLESVNDIGTNCLVSHLGIRFIDYTEDSITAEMPVDQRTKQPMGLLHGGASVALAESLGSVASVLCLDNPMEYMPVGVEINANHLSSATSGKVIGTCRPIRIGRTMHVWDVDIRDESGKRICVSRLTVAVVKQDRS
ncbi:MAG: hotdog fold thioesterase [Bacteroidetes bacterium]|nr:hotdog fold thioesterase [Bacteroidota bacterium]